MYLYDYDNRSIRLILKIAKRFDEMVQNEIDRNKLNPSYQNLLSAVFFNNGANQHVLARQLGLKAPSISVMIRNLEAEKFVKRKIDPFDGRATKVFLTEYGTEVEDKIMAFEDKLMESFLEDFTEEERFQLIELLERVEKNAVKQAEPATL